ncbi:hypothetical protein GFY24_19885 [Nocardia sp. SYP-A9097]|uniref:hypothetical protein n=1 Tax=Nocardia sp. SYP-A9097 TaxID=2663237 RepID=UPI00129A311D|nr:hypothetical protein [Nocardia sp. SYP-A9097]MRH89678.1 hypothetical protein [Nocardia sp. SYP-A9097]
MQADPGAAYADLTPQTASGKVLWHFTMSLDGFVAGPNHEMDWMTGIAFHPGWRGGEGIRLYDNPGTTPIRLHQLGTPNPTATLNVRYHPITPPTG